MRRWNIYLGIAVGALAVIYAIYWPSYQTPLGLAVGLEKVDSNKYELTVEPYYARYEPSSRPAVIIILPSARELGKPPMRSIQLSAVGPRVGEVLIDDAEVRGNVVIVRLDGKFGQVLEDWLSFLGNATGVEPSIHIYLWYGDEYLGFAVVNYNPHKLASRNVTYVVKAQVITSEKPVKIKPRDSSGYHFSRFGLDCGYEWRYSFTIIDTEKDLGGKIPLFFIYNQYSYSGEIGLSLDITIVDKLYISAGVALGYEIGPVGVTIKELWSASWDIKDNTTRIASQFSVLPEEAYWYGVYGKLTIDRYDEWYVCRDRGVTVSASRTGNVMFATKVHYLRKDSTGRTLAFGERLSASQLLAILELRDYYKLLGTLRADVSSVQSPKFLNIGGWMVNQLHTQCPGGFSLDAPAGVIIAAGIAVFKGINYIKQNPLLLLIPLSVDADFVNKQGVEYKVIYENLGARHNRGYDVVEYVDIYAIASKVKISDSCEVDLPVGFLISR